MEVQYVPFLIEIQKMAYGNLETSLVAGKSTLLQILAGRRLLTQPGTDVRIKDRDVFRQYPAGVTFLGTEWYVSVP